MKLQQRAKTESAAPFNYASVVKPRPAGGVCLVTLSMFIITLSWSVVLRQGTQRYYQGFEIETDELLVATFQTQHSLAIPMICMFTILESQFERNSHFKIR